jgi:hypothetical protein
VEYVLVALIRPFMLLALCLIALPFRLRAERMPDSALKRLLLWRLDPHRRAEKLFQRADAWVYERFRSALQKGIHLVRGR